MGRGCWKGKYGEDCSPLRMQWRLSPLTAYVLVYSRWLFLISLNPCVLQSLGSYLYTLCPLLRAPWPLFYAKVGGPPCLL